jgi:DNA-binding response OmpR family regulator
MPGRILIVDDEPSILATMAPLLRGRGYEVSTATTGHAALDAVDRQPPQLVILDLGLPDLDGIEVCRRLREGRSIPILVLSARGPTTTSRSRSARRSSWRASARPFAAARARPRRPPARFSAAI